MKTKSRKSLHYVQHETNVEKFNDTRAMPWVIENTNECEICLISFLEKETILAERDEFKIIVIKPGEKKLLPHQFFTIESQSARGSFMAHPAPKNSNFIYSKRLGSF